MNVSRRAWLKASALVPLAAACARPRASPDVLRGLVLDLATEDARTVVATSAQLAESLRVAVSGGPAALASAREAWKTALLCWQRASCFQTAPLVKSHALLRAMFFPVRAPAVEQLALSAAPANDASVTELGVDRKGMFALEVLLFGSAGANEPPLCERTGTQGDAARRWAHVLAANVVTYAHAASYELGDGKAFADVYAQGGHESLSRLVSQMIGTIGSITSGRLSNALLPAETAKPGQIQGYSSRTALDILVTLVGGVERVYRGGPRGGLAELVHATSAPADASLRARFTAASAALDRARHAETVARSRELAAAHEAVRALDRSLEGEFLSALGVTLLFAGPDAD